MYIESLPLGVRGKGFQGESFFTTPNPKVGAVFTYHLKDDIKTIKEKRQETEKEKIKKSEAPYYPSLDSLRLEDEQPAPHLLFTVSDENNNVVRRIKAPAKKGMSRIVWDFRYAPFGPVDLTPFDESNAFSSPEIGYLALPGNYKVSLSKFEDGVYTELTAAQSFKAVALNNATLPATDKKALEDFCKQVAELRRVSAAADEYRSEMVNKIKYIKQVIIETPNLPLSVSKTIAALEKRLTDVNTKLNGDATLARREFESSPSINGRIGSIAGGLWTTTAAPTTNFINSYQTAARQFTPVYNELKAIGTEMKNLENILDTNKAPYTPGRLPEWNGN